MATAALIVAILIGYCAPQAHAAALPRSAAPAVASHSEARIASYIPLPRRLIALRWAHSQRGTWYCWGGSGGCFDCSGLVMAAYAHAGIYLPHNTVSMLYSGHLRWEPRSQAHWGDLVMWGGSYPFHVELFNGYNGLLTFGAHSGGEQIGYAWQGGWWYWSENFYRVV